MLHIEKATDLTSSGGGSPGPHLLFSPSLVPATLAAVCPAVCSMAPTPAHTHLPVCDAQRAASALSLQAVPIQVQTLAGREGRPSGPWIPGKMPSRQQHLHHFGKEKISFHFKNQDVGLYSFSETESYSTLLLYIFPAQLPLCVCVCSEVSAFAFFALIIHFSWETHLAFWPALALCSRTRGHSWNVVQSC